MTSTAAQSLQGLTDTVLELFGDLDEREWMRPSSCPGWTLHDVLIHLTCTLRQVADPDSLPAPVPGSIERTNDAEVAVFRSQAPSDTLRDYQRLAPPALEEVRRQQVEPQASESIDFDDAGIYPMSLVADSLVFDHYCHLRHDLGEDLAPVVHGGEVVGIQRSTLAWLLAGLPQMSPPRLAGSLREPVDLNLTGPGGGTWTLARSTTGVEVLPARDGSAAGITSSFDDFILWGTHRKSWREVPVRLSGDAALAERVLDAIHVF